MLANNNAEETYWTFTHDNLTGCIVGDGLTLIHPRTAKVLADRQTDGSKLDRPSTPYRKRPSGFTRTNPDYSQKSTAPPPARPGHEAPNDADREPYPPRPFPKLAPGDLPYCGQKMVFPPCPTSPLAHVVVTGTAFPFTRGDSDSVRTPHTPTTALVAPVPRRDPTTEAGSTGTRTYAAGNG